MKRLLAMVLTLILCFSLCSCDMSEELMWEAETVLGGITDDLDDFFADLFSPIENLGETIADFFDGLFSGKDDPDTGAPADDGGEMPSRYITVQNADVAKGNLVLINPEHPYDDKVTPELVPVVKTPNYGSNKREDYLNAQALAAFDAMMEAFVWETGNRDAVVNAYRDYDGQNTYVSESYMPAEYFEQAGHSEIHTGLALDLWFHNGMYGYYDEELTGWFAENGYAFGYIDRYSLEKVDISGYFIAYIPDFYGGSTSGTIRCRYVGIPHAQIMHEKDYCLEEYHEYLTQFTLDGNYLWVDRYGNVSVMSGDTYPNRGFMIYSVPVNEAKGKTEIHIPVGCGYDISGNNEAHFIVTVYLDEESKAAALPETDSTKETPGFDETASEGLAYSGTATTGIYIEGIGTCTDTDIVIPSKINGIPVTMIQSGAFVGTDITSVVIPDTVTDVGFYAFASCASLRSVVLPTTLKVIRQELFRDCVSLESVNIPAGVTAIGPKAFFSCRALTQIEIPRGVTFIGHNCFGHTAIRELEIPDSVTEIEYGAFANCRYITSVRIPRSVEKMGNNVFTDCKNLRCIILETSSVPSGWNKNWLEGCGAQAVEFWRAPETENYTVVDPALNESIGVALTEADFEAEDCGWTYFVPNDRNIYLNGTPTEVHWEGILIREYKNNASVTAQFVLTPFGEVADTEDYVLVFSDAKVVTEGYKDVPLHEFQLYFLTEEMTLSWDITEAVREKLGLSGQELKTYMEKRKDIYVTVRLEPYAFVYGFND